MTISDTLPSPQERIADTQRKYNEKLRDERPALVMQHRLLNLQTPYIARLPDEVLLEIFERYYEITKYDMHAILGISRTLRRIRSRSVLRHSLSTRLLPLARIGIPYSDIVERSRYGLA